MKAYYYKNSLGLSKKLEIKETPTTDNKYHCMLWGEHGEFCGSADLTLAEIQEYFHNNKIEGEFKPS